MAGQINQSKTIKIAITFDAEFDDFDSSVGQSLGPALEGIKYGYGIAREILDRVGSIKEQKVVATWFVRCDDQIRSLTGKSDFLLREYASYWKDCQDNGHEIGFHPHLYRKGTTRWVQDFEEKSQVMQIFRSWEAATSTGLEFKSSRIGEAYSNNIIMQVLDSLDVTIDSTAMPGRVRKDSERCIDWGTTPCRIYHPSINDYRIPGDSAYRIMEAPMSMLSTLARYDEAPLYRYLDLSFHAECLLPGINQLVKGSDTLVTVTHLSTLLKRSLPHGLISFDAQVFESNLSNLIDLCNRAGKKVEFIRLGDISGRAVDCHQASI